MVWVIDTNILISAALFPDSVPARAFMKAVSWPHHAAICDYSLEEMRQVYERKFPHKLSIFECFTSLIEHSIDIIPAPKFAIYNEIAQRIRDKKDLPILAAAISVDADGIITGDKDFLESGITKPKMLSPAQFVELAG